MSEKKIKWGFIGCGEVTKYKSGPAFQKVEGSEVIAVMSRDGAKAKAYAKERGIPKWYDDAQELIDDEDVNAILSISFGFGAIATHDSNYFRTFHLLEGGTTFIFGHFSATQ